MKQWAKREEQTDRVLQATVGMYGDLQGIAGDEGRSGAIHDMDRRDEIRVDQLAEGQR